MGYSRLLEILANIKNPTTIKALAVCSGIAEYKVAFFLMKNAEALGIRFSADKVYTEEMLDEKNYNII